MSKFPNFNAALEYVDDKKLAAIHMYSCQIISKTLGFYVSSNNYKLENFTITINNTLVPIKAFLRNSLQIP